MKIPTYKEVANNTFGWNPLEKFIYDWESFEGPPKISEDFHSDLQNLVDWLLTQCQCDEREE